MSTTEALAAIRKTLMVDASVETAFETFTKRMGDWWPEEPHTVFDDRVAVVVDERVDGRVYERAADGREADWADVIAWQPPSRLVLRWRVNPERGPTEMEVRFSTEGERTRVDLEHRGWDEIVDAEGRARYDGGWDKVLGGFVASLNR
jgi:Activator of Hsp90 ATPase homolog 1-like protein